LPAAKIIVIAPDEMFRHSLSFALEAEGHVVTTHATIVEPEAARGYDCVVLDQKAANLATREAVERFCRSSAPVVLLAGHSPTWLTPRVYRVVQMPPAGEDLAEAVRAAAGRHAARPAAG
jgi:FixJ family two-component response regulator